MICLIGGSGYVGQAFQKYFLERDIKFKSIRRCDLDYYDSQKLAFALKAEKVNFLINAAGYTGKPNVDACEKDKSNCLLGNAVLPARIAEACELAGIDWGHVSSGCIYTGCRKDGFAFTEEDEPNFTFRQNNCSFYSGSKALGEEVINQLPNVFIWRLRIPFESHNNPRNYLTKLMTYDKLINSTNSITNLHEFVDASFSCWEQRVPFGIYNIVNPGSISTCEIVEMIKSAKICQKEFEYFKDERDFMSVTSTPRSNCIMSSKKLESLGIFMTPVRESIKRALENWH